MTESAIDACQAAEERAIRADRRLAARRGEPFNPRGVDVDGEDEPSWYERRRRWEARAARAEEALARFEGAGR